MNTDTIKSIVFLGAGNLATHLSQAICEAGFSITQVYSRTEASSRTLGNILRAGHTCRIEEIFPDADLYFFALADEALVPVLKKMQVNQGIFLHTAGSVSMDVFRNYAAHYGVFYPLQTFTKNQKTDFSQIPLCIEGNTPELQQTLLSLGRCISPKVYPVSSEQRQQLHLAAVFACNFANHMYCIGQELLDAEELDFDLLRPLIMETARKVQEMKPVEAQTGPAVRFDRKVLKKHEQILKASPMFQKIYRFVSASIQAMHSEKPDTVNK